MFISHDFTLNNKSRGTVDRAIAIGSIRSAADRRMAVQLVKDGFPVGLYVRGVAVIVVNGARPGAADTINLVKGERRTGKPLATILPTETFVQMIDPKMIPSELRKIFLDPDELEARLGTLGSIRFPLRPSVAPTPPPTLAPRSEDGTHWLQSWVPDQTSAGGLLVKEFQQQGVAFPGVSSMNTSGNPEIVDQDEARSFGVAHQLAYFLGDPQIAHSVRGSFPILQIGPRGVGVIRQGHFSAALFQRLLDGVRVDESQAIPAKYPLLPMDSLASITSPYQLHDRLVALLEGTAS